MSAKAIYLVVATTGHFVSIIAFLMQLKRE